MTYRTAIGLMAIRFTLEIPAMQVVRDSDTHPYCLGCRVWGPAVEYGPK